MATLVPSWGQLWRFWGCAEGYMGSFWTMLLRHSRIAKNNPKIHLRNARPLALKVKQNQTKNRLQTQKLRQNANLHGSKGKTQPKILPKPIFKTLSQWPCSLNLFPDWQNKGPPPSRAIWDDNVFARVTSSKARAPLARPSPTAVWADFFILEPYCACCNFLKWCSPEKLCKVNEVWLGLSRTGGHSHGAEGVKAWSWHIS